MASLSDEQTTTHKTAQPRLLGAGVFWINSGVIDKTVLPYEKFVEWYEGIHIPDMMRANSTKPIPAAWRYECLDKSWPSPFLAIYKFPDLKLAGAKEMRTVPITHPSLPGGGPISRIAVFRALFSRHLETWRKVSITADSGHGLAIISEVIELGGDLVEQFHQWYRQTYIQEVSKLEGWRSTTRFEILIENEIGKGGQAAGTTIPRGPGWLSLHEFDDDSFDNHQVLSSLLRSSDATMTFLKNTKKIEVVPFKLVRAYGQGDTAYVDSDMTIL